MKIRHGFVSNSSSSSFIVYLKACRPGKDYNEFLEKLQKLEDGYDSYYGSWFGNEDGRDENFEIQGNYIHIGSWHAPEELWPLVDEYFDDEDMFSLDY